jgi:hypothetical protein
MSVTATSSRCGDAGDHQMKNGFVAWRCSATRS